MYQRELKEEAAIFYKTEVEAMDLPHEAWSLLRDHMLEMKYGGTLRKITLANARYVGNIEFETDLSGCIRIIDLDNVNEPICLNDHESDQFMSEAKKYFDECDVTMDIAMKAVAKPYVECVWN